MKERIANGIAQAVYLIAVLAILYCTMTVVSWIVYWALGIPGWTMKTPIAFVIVWAVWRFSVELAFGGEDEQEE